MTANYNFDWDEREGAPAFFQIIATRPDVYSYFAASPSYGGAAFSQQLTQPDEVLQSGFNDRNGNNRFTSKTRVQGHALTLAWEASDAVTLKSITGYRKFFQDTILGLSGNGDLRGPAIDFTSPTLVSVQSVTPYNGNNAPQTQDQWSQEVQLLGKFGDFNVLAGGYYFHEESAEYNRQALTVVLPVASLAFAGFDQAFADAVAAANPTLSTVGLNLNPVQAFSGTAESVAAFGQVSWKPASLDERLEVTVGGRYTSDKKTLLLQGDVQPNLSDGTKFDNFSWLGSVSYKFSPGVMAYARASSGYRSGGINPRTDRINKFEPETTKAYELGLKSDFLDRRVRVNLSGYYTDYSNLQIQQFAGGTGGATALIVNAGKSEVWGFEAEVIVNPFEGFTLDGSVGNVNTKYKSFLFRDPNTDVVSDVAAVAKPVYTPKWSAHLGAEYFVPLGNADLRLRADYSFRTKMYFNALTATTPFNENIAAPRDHNLKMRLSFENIEVGGAKLDLGVWGDNITNERQLIYGIDFGTLGFAGANFKKPATWGIDARISY